MIFCFLCFNFKTQKRQDEFRLSSFEFNQLLIFQPIARFIVTVLEIALEIRRQSD